jgi:hypothetical protein
MSKELFTVNYDKVLSDPSISALTKLTAMELKTQQYLTLAEFIQGLSESDLEGLVQSFDKLSDDRVINDVIILAEIVASGEGDSIFNNDENERMSNLCYFVNVVTCESLKRKGLITIDYKNVTFDPAYKDKIFAKVV